VQSIFKGTELGFDQIANLSTSPIFLREQIERGRESEGLQPVYGEYNIGPFRRSFRISSRIDQDKIKAEMRDGVITLTLPKVEQAKSRRIELRSG